MSAEIIKLPIEQQVRLEKLMMCSVAERYAFLYAIGLPHAIISNIDLNSTPYLAAHQIVYKIPQYFTGSERERAVEYIQSLLTFPLATGIPE